MLLHKMSLLLGLNGRRQSSLVVGDHADIPLHDGCTRKLEVAMTAPGSPVSELTEMHCRADPAVYL